MKQTAWQIRARALLGRHMSRMMQRLALSAFSSWQSTALTSTVRKNTIGMIVRRLQRLELAAALQRWLMFTTETRQLVTVAARVVARLRDARVARAFGRWVEYWEQLRRLGRIGSRLLTLRLSRAVSTWVAWTVECRSELVAEQHRHSLAAAQAELDTHKSAVVGRRA